MRIGDIMDIDNKIKKLKDEIESLQKQKLQAKINQISDTWLVENGFEVSLEYSSLYETTVYVKNMSKDIYWILFIEQNQSEIFGVQLFTDGIESDPVFEEYYETLEEVVNAIDNCKVPKRYRAVVTFTFTADDKEDAECILEDFFLALDDNIHPIIGDIKEL